MWKNVRMNTTDFTPLKTFENICLKAFACLVVLLVWSAVAAHSLPAGNLFIDYSNVPDADKMLAYDLVILDPAAKADLHPGQRLGNKYLAYLSLVEVRKDAWYLQELKQRGIPLAGKAQTDDAFLVDITATEWQYFFMDILAARAAGLGFDGFFLDTADSAAGFAAGNPARADACNKALVQMVKRLREKYPDRQVIINRGFAVLPDLFSTVNGVLIESLFQTYDFQAKRYGDVHPEDTRTLCLWIEKIKAAGLPVYVVDYMDPKHPEKINATVRRIREKDCVPFITTPDLHGAALGPLAEVPRKILVVYGWAKGDEKKPILPADTMTAERLQMPLEWMGYECVYLNAGENMPPESMTGQYAGIIFDSELALPYEKEMRYAEWLLAQKESGLKVLFAGAFPFQQDDAGKLVRARLGIRGTGDRIRAAQSIDIINLDKTVMNYEAPVPAAAADIDYLQAPPGSKVFLSVRGSADNATAVFDPVFAAPWGGALFEPFVSFAPSPEDMLSTFDPFLFLAEIWPAGVFPAPDPTTRDGLRVLMSHIDGDGFPGPSPLARNTISAEIIRDRILKVFAFPVTVSVIEADIRAAAKELLPENHTHYEETARSIFALPNVQAASHSYAHPYVWMRDDPDYVKLYKERFMELQDSAAYRNIDYRREIAGSISYIEKNLLPRDKKVELMLWTGNCRPPAEAIALTRTLGIENMNGGDTIISARHPGIAGVAPRTIPVGEELQIYAPNQNEYIYTNDWSGPFYGGFSRVIDTFQRTESPRRLKPVDIYFHFYSGSKQSSLRALEKVFRWAQAQPLHALTGLQYARTARDSRQTRVFCSDSRRWMIINDGYLRTLRMPRARGVPDMAASSGITGYAEDRGWLYIHTSGQQRTVLTLADHPAPHLRLVSSTGEIIFDALKPDHACFAVKDCRPVSVVFDAAEPKSMWLVIVNGGGGDKITADAAGLLRLSLPPTAKVTVSKQGTR